MFFIYRLDHELQLALYRAVRTLHTFSMTILRTLTPSCITWSYTANRPLKIGGDLSLATCQIKTLANFPIIWYVICRHWVLTSSILLFFVSESGRSSPDSIGGSPTEKDSSVTLLIPLVDIKRKQWYIAAANKKGTTSEAFTLECYPSHHLVLYCTL